MSIKVDREERPDVDTVYIAVARRSSSTIAGWPLNLVLTPDGKPFFAATYLPKERLTNVFETLGGHLVGASGTDHRLGGDGHEVVEREAGAAGETPVSRR